MVDEGRLREIKEREARATEGPWRLGHHRGFGEEHDVDDSHGRELAGVRGMFYYRADAEFVAHAREDVPWLVGALEGTLAELEGLRGRRAGSLEELFERIERGQRERGVEPLSEEEAMRLANEELRVWRRERYETGEADAGPREGED